MRRTKALTELPDHTYPNIFSTANNVPDGKYRFLNVVGTRQFELGYKNGNFLSEGKYTTHPPKNSAMQTNSIKTASYCIDWWLVTTYHGADGSSFTTTEYVTRTCTGGCEGGMNQSFCTADETGSEYTYSTVASRLWPVSNLNGTGIYKVNSFTIQDDYFIVFIGFGAFTTSNNVPDGVTITQHKATGEHGADFTTARTDCWAKVQYDLDPTNPTILHGWKVWAASDLN